MAFGFLKKAVRFVGKAVGAVARPALSLGAAVGIPGLTQANSVFGVAKGIFNKRIVRRPAMSFPRPAIPLAVPAPFQAPVAAFPAPAPDRATMLMVAAIVILVAGGLWLAVRS